MKASLPCFSYFKVEFEAEESSSVSVISAGGPELLCCIFKDFLYRFGRKVFTSLPRIHMPWLDGDGSAISEKEIVRVGRSFVASPYYIYIPY